MNNRNQPTPVYAEPSEVPFIKAAKRKRLTTTRTKQLLRAASRAHNDPPPPPGLGDCCGSSCDPCVRDLWKEELTCWRERWGDAADESGEEQTSDQPAEQSQDEKNGSERKCERMPGSWDCGQHRAGCCLAYSDIGTEVLW
ncbi:hypothetical protein DTO280E4_4164 [Paecilomyces variotii]|nr:hypothetical protein DTO280E4_4164 [Paecilomyces variotii]KAJ9390679.1 hypothetical protein DTO063F5_1629 [Paecilomyces variotii]